MVGAEPASLVQHEMRAHVRFGSLADVRRQLGDVCFTPESGHQAAGLPCPLSAMNMAELFDHLIGGEDQTLRKLKPKRLGGLKVDYEFEPGGLYDRQVGGLLAI